MAENPFFGDFYEKPEWLAKKVHIKREGGFGEHVAELARRARNGEFVAIALLPERRGVGMTHFIIRDLKSELEKNGVESFWIDRLASPFDANLPKMLDLPDAVARISKSFNEKTNVDEKWLPPARQAAVAEKKRREGTGISSLSLPQYPAKIFAHSVERAPGRPSYEEAEENWHPFSQRRRNSDEKYTLLEALGSVASRSGKALCMIGVSSSYFSKGLSKRRAEADASYVRRECDMFRNAKNLILISIVDSHNPFLPAQLANCGVTPIIVRAQNMEWTEKVIHAHQNEAKDKLLSDEAVRVIARKYKGQPATALLICKLMVEKAIGRKMAFPITGRQASSMMNKVSKMCGYRSRIKF